MMTLSTVRARLEGWHDGFVHQLARADAQWQPALMGLVAGLLTGIVIVAFRAVVEWSQAGLLPGQDPEAFERLSLVWRFLLPVVSGLLIGMIFQILAPDDQVVGIVHVMERLAYHQGRLPLRKFLLQLMGAGLAIVGGHSIGREGPSVHLGAATGSLLGQHLGVPNNNIRILVASGTAAAIAASFNTPLAGVVFAMEVVMLEYTITSFIPVILAAVSATGISVAVYENSPVFVIPEFAFSSLRELPYVVLLGLLCGVLATLFIRLVARIASLTREWPFPVKTTMAGVAVGFIGIGFPQVLGIGYDTVSEALSGQLGVALLLGILLAKIIATGSAVALGVPGGVVGPTLFMGAMLGSSLGHVVTAAAPAFASEIGFYTLLGMTALMGAMFRAPLAALLAILELTYSPTVIFPGMLAIVVAELVRSELFHQTSFFRSLLQARGLDINMNPLTQALQRIGVASQMSTRFVVLPPNAVGDEVRGALEREPHWILLQSGDAPDTVLPAIDVVRYLEEFPDIDRVDLANIPAKRDAVEGIHKRGSLLDAEKKMREAGVNMLYVYDMPAPAMRRIRGVIDRGIIESSYRL